MKEHCAGCHGPQGRKAELDLTRPEGILQGGESGGPAVVRGKSTDSPLYEQLDSGAMPPGNAPRPTASQIARIREWIDAGAPGLEGTADPVNDNARQVFHVLEWKCYTCHGRRVRQGDLDLRTRESMLVGGRSGPAVVPGKAAESLLSKKLHADEMPPFKQRYPFSVKPVSPTELAAIEQWIDAGAPAPRYDVLDAEPLPPAAPERTWWAYRPPTLPAIPVVQAAEQIRNSIDAFLLARLEQAGLQFSSPAEPRVLIRRVYDDLWGLPPTPEEVDAFLGDPAPNAYEQLVDRLLAAPQYAERQAQHWLDAAGFAESEGLESADPIFPELYRYRDYVVRSLHADKPFDRFLTEQLAGDELVDWRAEPVLTPELADNVVATGYLRTAMDSTREPAVNFYVNRLQVLDDTVEILSSSLLGLSLRCARCHSHKYDPISQRDYYRFAAIFAAAYSPQDWLRPAERLQPLLTKAEQARLETDNATLQARIGPLEKQLDELNENSLQAVRERRLAALPAEIGTALRAALAVPREQRTREQRNLLAVHAQTLRIKVEELPAEVEGYAAAAQPLQAELTRLKAELGTAPQAHALTDVAPDAAPFYLLSRGDWDRRGPRVTPGVPAVLGTPSAPYLPEPTPAGTTGRRLALARWLLHRDHPLTARVFVNRAWRQFFGRGIVATLGEFGRVGSSPTHPELLDHLALQFVDDGWSIKRLHRAFVLSAVYRQQSRVLDQAREIDPENQLLWRMPLRRRDAESLRDGLLAIAGTLNEHRGGPSSTTETLPDGQVITPPGGEHRRRSVYMLHRRLTPETILETFDAPRMSPNCLERRTSTVVNQSLLMLHSRFVEEQSTALAARVRREVVEEPRAQIDRLYRLALCRPATPAEIERFVQFLLDAQRESGDPLAELALVLINSAEFLYVD